MPDLGLDPSLILQGSAQASSAEPNNAAAVQNQLQSAQQAGQSSTINAMNIYSQNQQIQESNKVTAALKQVTANVSDPDYGDQVAKALKNVGASGTTQLAYQKSLLATQLDQVNLKASLQKIALGQLAMNQNEQAQVQTNMDKFSMMGSNVMDLYNSLKSSQPAAATAAATTQINQMFSDEQTDIQQQLKNGTMDQKTATDLNNQLQAAKKQIMAGGKFNPTALQHLLDANQQLRGIKKDLQDEQLKAAQAKEATARANEISRGVLVPVQDPNDPTKVIYMPASKAEGLQAGAKPSATNTPLNPKEQAVYSALQDNGGGQLIGGFGGMEKVKAALDAELTSHPNDSPLDIAKRMIGGHNTLIAQQSQARVVGNRIGGLALASHELPGMIAQVRQAASAAGQSNWVPVNAVDQVMSNTVRGNPARAKLFTAIQGLGNAYQQILTRGGMTTEGAREAANKLVSSITGVDALNSAMDQMSTEQGIANMAASDALSEIQAGKNIASPSSNGSTSSATSDPLGIR